VNRQTGEGSTRPATSSHIGRLSSANPSPQHSVFGRKEIIPFHLHLPAQHILSKELVSSIPLSREYRRRGNRTALPLQTELNRLKGVGDERQYFEAEGNIIKQMVAEGKSLKRKDKYKVLDRLINMKYLTMEDRQNIARQERIQKLVIKFVNIIKNNLWAKREAEKMKQDPTLMEKLRKAFHPMKTIFTMKVIKDLEKSSGKKMVGFAEGSARASKASPRPYLQNMEEKVTSIADNLPSDSLTKKQNTAKEEKEEAMTPISRLNSMSRKVSTLVELDSPRSATLPSKKRFIKKASFDLVEHLKRADDEKVKKDAERRDDNVSPQIGQFHSLNPSPVMTRQNSSIRIPAAAMADRSGVMTAGNLSRKIIVNRAQPQATEAQASEHSSGTVPSGQATLNPPRNRFSRLIEVVSTSPISQKRWRKISNLARPSPNAGFSTEQIGMLYLKLLKDKGVELNARTENIGKEIMLKLGEIELIEADRINDKAFNNLKIMRIYKSIDDQLRKVKKEMAEESQKQVDGAIRGDRLRKQIQEIKIRRRQQDTSCNKAIMMLKKTKDKYFYEIEGDNLQVHRYSDYANDLVLADILGHLLIKDTDKEIRMAFLNNANMHHIDRTVRGLTVDVETEMLNIQKEKVEYSKANGVQIDEIAEDKRCFKNMLKRSRFQKALISTHRETKHKHKHYFSINQSTISDSNLVYPNRLRDGKFWNSKSAKLTRQNSAQFNDLKEGSTGLVVKEGFKVVKNLDWMNDDDDGVMGDPEPEEAVDEENKKRVRFTLDSSNIAQ